MVLDGPYTAYDLHTMNSMPLARIVLYPTITEDNQALKSQDIRYNTTSLIGIYIYIYIYIYIKSRG